MPEIVFKGKEYVYNHHLAVPYRPLVVHADKGIGAPDLAGNLVIHGDNLVALKSLLLRYAGQVDLVFIDPPYNTGNEGWCYSDNVNSPIMREWLSSNPVDGEDLLRHDKWLCMMWPRLVLLRELLSERGSLWITLDDNEVHRARMVLDEVFGEENELFMFIWRKVDSPNDNKVPVTPDHDYVIAFAKDKSRCSLRAMEDEGILAAYPHRTSDGRLYRDRLLKKNGKNSLRKDRETMWFPVENPDGDDVYPIHETGEEARWAMGPSAVAAHRLAGTLIWKRRTKLGREVWEPYTREFAPEVPTRPYPTIWADLHTMRQTQAELRSMFGATDVFATPKPTDLIERVMHVASASDALILDSFAGSGTTAHAVLKANAKDGGSRRFILVEGEDYADTLTAERVRRAISGYAWQGTQRETLLEQKITFTQLKKADQLLQQVEAIKAREGFADGDLADQGRSAPKRFDRIEAKVDDGLLRVEGVRSVSERAPGLGGSFTYCTLGPAIELEKLLSGEHLPAADALGAWLFHTATGGTLQPPPAGAPAWYLSEAQDKHVWLIYRPDLAFLKSPDAALTLTCAREFADWGRSFDAARQQRKGHLVLAPAKYLSNKQLRELGIDYAPLPFALYRES
jgi:adenine-specific DNA-methyltransferase